LALLEIQPCRNFQEEQNRLTNRLKIPTKWIRQSQPSSSPAFRAI
jgi:hypothetical protein